MDAVGHRIKQRHANGAMALSTHSSTRGWLTILEHRQSNNAVLARYEYTRDAAGYTTSVTQRSDHVVDYAYATAYQLTGEARTGTNAYSVGYTYDAAGNRLTKVQNSVTESCAFGATTSVWRPGARRMPTTPTAISPA